MYCIHCGKDNREDASFCYSCGKPIEGVEIEPEIELEQNSENQTPYSGLKAKEFEDIACISTVNEVVDFDKRDNMDNSEPYNLDSEEVELPKYKGVKGWLLLFCISLLIYQPLTVIRELFSLQSETLLLMKYYIPVQLIVLVIVYFLLIFVASFGVYSSILLLKIKTNAISTVKKYLRISLMVSIVTSVLVIAAFLIYNPIDMLTIEYFEDIISGIIYYGIWSSYFKKSKRVAATYPGQ